MMWHAFVLCVVSALPSAALALPSPSAALSMSGLHSKSGAPRRLTRLSGGSVKGWYDARLRDAPLATKAVSSAVASGVGDALAQRLAPGAAAFDAARCGAFAVVGFAYFAPILQWWYGALARFEANWLARGRRRSTCLALQVLLNQSVGALLVNAGFFYAIELALCCVSLTVPTASTLGAGSAALRAKYWSVMKANWIIWPLPSLFNLAVVPLQYRVLWTNLVAIVWKCALSTLTRSGPRPR